MPLSPFSGPYVYKHNPTTVLPGTQHAFNMDNVTGDIAQQGTQIDALGHFAALPQPWDGKAESPANQGVYYGGYKQAEVKPTPDSPLLKLGMEKAPPIITSAVLLDAKTALGKGEPMKPGQLVTAKDIQVMLKSQGLAKRGLQPGDVLYVYTGWGDFWRDPDTEKFYYTKAPGLSYDAARYLSERRIVVIALDTPFVDPVNEGQLQGKSGPASGTPPGLPFAIHHHMLTQAGIHHIENANLGELAKDKVWTSCTMILPLREKGAAGSPVRPVAIGVPGR
jgi:kynurenine formamidase